MTRPERFLRRYAGTAYAVLVTVFIVALVGRTLLAFVH